MPITVARDAERIKSARFAELWHWLAGLGVCQSCSLAFALAAVEREMGDQAWRAYATPCTHTVRSPRGVAMTCKEAATLHWAGRPVRAGDT